MPKICYNEKTRKEGYDGEKESTGYLSFAIAAVSICLRGGFADRISVFAIILGRNQ